MGLKQTTAAAATDKMTTSAAPNTPASVYGFDNTTSRARSSHLSHSAQASYDVVMHNPEAVAFAQKVDEPLAVQVDVAHLQSLKSRNISAL